MRVNVRVVCYVFQGLVLLLIGVGLTVFASLVACCMCVYVRKMCVCARMRAYVSWSYSFSLSRFPRLQRDIKRLVS
jgi:hypothetical protein